MIVCSFDVPVQTEWDDIIIRECDYESRDVIVTSLDGGFSKKATVFCGYDNDEQLLHAKQKTYDEIYHSLHPEFLSLYQHPIYRRDILPSTPYLRLCMNAYLRAGHIENFVETSYLADRETPLQQYLDDLKWDMHDPESWV